MFFSCGKTTSLGKGKTRKNWTQNQGPVATPPHKKTCIVAQGRGKGREKKNENNQHLSPFPVEEVERKKERKKEKKKVYK